MGIARWNPFRELEEVSERLNRVVGRDVGSLSNDGSSMMTRFDWAPSVDIAETDTEFEIRAELPDVAKADVKVFLDQHVLRIEGERKQEKEDKGKRWHRVERNYGSFQRTFSLPDNVDESKVMAEFKDGVLDVHLPKYERNAPTSTQVKVH